MRSPCPAFGSKMFAQGENKWMKPAALLDRGCHPSWGKRQSSTSARNSTGSPWKLGSMVGLEEQPWLVSLEAAYFQGRPGWPQKVESKQDLETAWTWIICLLPRICTERWETRLRQRLSSGSRCVHIPLTDHWLTTNLCRPRKNPQEARLKIKKIFLKLSRDSSAMYHWGDKFSRLSPNKLLKRT